jgi:hypothetical protein
MPHIETIQIAKLAECRITLPPHGRAVNYQALFFLHRKHVKQQIYAARTARLTVANSGSDPPR